MNSKESRIGIEEDALQRLVFQEEDSSRTPFQAVVKLFELLGLKLSFRMSVLDSPIYFRRLLELVAQTFFNPEKGESRSAKSLLAAIDKLTIEPYLVQSAHADALFEVFQSGLERIAKIPKERKNSAKPFFGCLFCLANKLQLGDGASLSSDQLFVLPKGALFSFNQVDTIELVTSLIGQRQTANSNILRAEWRSGRLEVSQLGRDGLEVLIQGSQQQAQRFKIPASIARKACLEVTSRLNEGFFEMEVDGVLSVKERLPGFKQSAGKDELVTLGFSVGNPVLFKRVQLSCNGQEYLKADGEAPPNGFAKDSLRILSKKIVAQGARETIIKSTVALFAFFGCVEIDRSDAALVESFIQLMFRALTLRPETAKRVSIAVSSLLVSQEEKLQFNELVGERSTRLLLSLLDYLKQVHSVRSFKRLLSVVLSRFSLIARQSSFEELCQKAKSLVSAAYECKEKKSCLGFFALLFAFVRNVHMNTYYIDGPHEELVSQAVTTALELLTGIEDQALVAFQFVSSVAKFECSDCLKLFLRQLAEGKTFAKLRVLVSFALREVDIVRLAPSSTEWLVGVLLGSQEEDFKGRRPCVGARAEASGDRLLTGLFKRDFSSVEAFDRGEARWSVKGLVLDSLAALLKKSSLTLGELEEWVGEESSKPERGPKRSFAGSKAKSSVSQEILVNKTDLLIDTEEINKMFTTGGEKGKLVKR